MKQTYLTLLALLQDTGLFRYIDLDCGQIDNPAFNDRYPVAYPCALLDLSIDNAQDNTIYQQQCGATFGIRIAFDVSGNTDSITPDNYRVDALSFFDTLEVVFKKLQGYTDEHLGELSRGSVKPEKRADGLKVYRIPFTTSFMEDVS